LGPPESTSKRHLERFSRFAGLTIVTDRQYTSPQVTFITDEKFNREHPPVWKITKHVRSSVTLGVASSVTNDVIMRMTS